MLPFLIISSLLPSHFRELRHSVPLLLSSLFIPFHLSSTFSTSLLFFPPFLPPSPVLAAGKSKFARKVCDACRGHPVTTERPSTVPTTTCVYYYSPWRVRNSTAYLMHSKPTRSRDMLP